MVLISSFCYPGSSSEDEDHEDLKKSMFAIPHLAVSDGSLSIATEPLHNVPHISFPLKSRFDRVIVCQLLYPSYCPCGIVTNSNRCGLIAVSETSEQYTIKNKLKKKHH